MPREGEKNRSRDRILKENDIYRMDRGREAPTGVSSSIVSERRQ